MYRKNKYQSKPIISSEQGKAVICSTFDSATSALSFTDVLESVLQFSRDNVEQFVVVNIKSENVKHPVNTKELEVLIDERCKIHTELTAGTDEYKIKEVSGKKHTPRHVILKNVHSVLLLKPMFLVKAVGDRWVRLSTTIPKWHSG